MSNLSRSQIPPGGWQFTQPQTGWTAPTPIASTFDQTVVLIIKHRLANPVIVAKHNLRTDAPGVAAELEAFTRTRLNLPDSFSQPAAAPSKGTKGGCCGG